MNQLSEDPIEMDQSKSSEVGSQQLHDLRTVAWAGSPGEALQMVVRLEEEGIPAVVEGQAVTYIQAGGLPGDQRIKVPRTHLYEARAALKGIWQTQNEEVDLDPLPSEPEFPIRFGTGELLATVLLGALMSFSLIKIFNTFSTVAQGIQVFFAFLLGYAISGGGGYLASRYSTEARIAEPRRRIKVLVWAHLFLVLLLSGFLMLPFLLG